MTPDKCIRKIIIAMDRAYGEDIQVTVVTEVVDGIFYVKEDKHGSRGINRRARAD